MLKFLYSVVYYSIRLYNKTGGSVDDVEEETSLKIPQKIDTETF